MLAPVIAPGNPALITSLGGETSLPGTSVWHHTQGTRRLRPHRVGFPQLAIRRIHRRPGRHRDRNAGRSGLRFTRGICNSISPTTVRRWLTEHAIKPWQYRSWIFITDPNFRAKAQKVLDLYAREWNGKPLTANEYVISADEKTSILARCRCHPTLPPGRARTILVNHDYHRGGAVAYLAATTCT